MRRSFRLVAALVLAATCATGCDLTPIADVLPEEGEGPIPVIGAPPSYPSGTVVFTVLILDGFNGEQIELHLDDVLFYRKALTSVAGETLTDRARFAALPGSHRLFARVGTETYNVSTELPVNIGAQTCATVRFAYNPSNPRGSRVTLATPPQATCPR